MQRSSLGQTWNATTYAANGRFVATLATPVVTLLAPKAGEDILDLGCGDGALTQQIAATGAHLTGVDLSPTMLAAARARGINVLQSDAAELPFNQDFDAVFSNAALHWIPLSRQPATLAAVHRVLRRGGRFVAEMGAQGNIAAIRTALQCTLAPHELDAEALAASFFPSPTHYRALIEQAGFQLRSIELVPRPTPLPGGPEGMRNWLNTFRNGVLDRLPADQRDHALQQTVQLLAHTLQDPLTGNWTADYVRLRFHAVRP